MNEKLTPFWKKVGDRRYETLPIAERPNTNEPIIDLTLCEHGIIRNATIKFKVEVLACDQDFNAALLFRKNGSSYLGAGLGGWLSYCSIFSHSTSGFRWLTTGNKALIRENTIHDFLIEFRGGFLIRFVKDGETYFPRLSFRDSLQSTLRSGFLGLYAYDKTQAAFELTVEKHDTRCFIITNINETGGKDNTNRRRKRFEDALTKADIKNVVFLDSRDLTRELPLMIKIKEGICEADLVIADWGLGQPRLNVPYETGIAHSVGVPVVHIGPLSNKFHKCIPSDLKQQYFLLEHEITSKLALTVRQILETPEGDFSYL